MNVPENMTLQATVDQPDEKSPFGDNKKLAEWFSWPGRVAVLIAVLVAPWMYGSVNPGPQRFVMVCLLVGVASWWFESAITQRRKQVVPYLTLLVILGLLIGFLQTIALPTSLADMLVGRQVEIYQKFSEVPGTAARITVDREATVSQLQLLIIALSGLLLGSRYFRTKRDMLLLLGACSANGVAIAFFGMVHKLTAAPGKIFWTIDLTYGGSPIGPFVNRNNASGYLLMCLACAIGLAMLVMSKRKTSGPVPMVSNEMPFWRQFYFHAIYFVAELTATKLAVLIAIVLIASGVVSTLSRGGLLALIIGSIGTLVIYGMARKPKYTGFILLPLVGLVFALTGWIGFSEQMWKRFDNTDLVNSSSELRVQNWEDTWPAVEEMGWFGSGLGSYGSLHRLYRSDNENSLFAHAENQFMQGVVEAGWPGVFLFCLAWLLLFQYSALMLYSGSSPSTIAVGTLGAFVFFSQVPASCFDFGLYVPSNTILLAVLCGFVAYHAQSLAGRLKQRSWLSFEVPNLLVQGLLLVLFAVGFLATLQLHRDTRQLAVTSRNLAKTTDQSLGIEQTDAVIEQVRNAAGSSPNTATLNHLAQLWMHRARLEFLEVIRSDPDFAGSLAMMTDEEQTRVQSNLWKLTSLPRIQEHAYFLKRDISKFRAARFLSSDFIRNNLGVAAKYLQVSRQRQPLQPLVHLWLGQIRGIMESTRRTGDLDVERAIALSPANGDYRKTAAIYYLQSGEIQPATVHLRKLLELKPRAFREILGLLSGKSSQTLALVDEQVIYQQILPDSPSMLYSYATDYLSPESDVRSNVLAKADQLLGVPQAGDLKAALLKARIKLALGEVGQAIEFLQIALVSRPDDAKTRFSLATLLQKTGDLDRALEEAQHLTRLNKRKPKYMKLINELETEIRRRSDSSLRR